MTSANELIVKLIDEGKISGEEALTLIEATQPKTSYVDRVVYRDCDWWRYPRITWYATTNNTSNTLSLNN